jgi:hypothetical protein
MITAEVPTTLDQSELLSRSHRASLINSSAIHSVVPWKYTALLRLHDLERALGVSGAPAQAASLSAIMFARTILDAVKGDNLPTPSVCPASGSGVALIWTVGSKQLEAIFGSDKLGSFVLSDGDDIVHDGEIAAGDAASLAGALNDILAG